MTVHFHEVCQYGYVHTRCYCTEPTNLRQVSCATEVDHAAAAEADALVVPERES